MPRTPRCICTETRTHDYISPLAQPCRDAHTREAYMHAYRVYVYVNEQTSTRKLFRVIDKRSCKRERERDRQWQRQRERARSGLPNYKGFSRVFKGIPRTNQRRHLRLRLIDRTRREKIRSRIVISRVYTYTNTRACNAHVTRSVARCNRITRVSELNTYREHSVNGKNHDSHSFC